jgi:hypothetical protein
MRQLVAIFLGIALCSPSLAQPAEFFAETIYAIAGATYDVRSVDLDHDGDLDLVASAFGSAGVSVLLNEGDGNFAPPVFYGVANGIRSVAVGDFNGDGDQDVVASAAVQTLYFLPGAGDGTLGSAVPSVDDEIGSHAVDLAEADFDQDGDLDVAALTSGIVLLFTGNGDGTFARTDFVNVFDGSIQYGGLVAGDLNGDGFPDVCFGNGEAQLFVALNDMEGNLGEATEVETSVGAYDVATADVDGDGDTDLVATGDGSIQVFANDGAGAFASVGRASASGFSIGNSVSTADLNLDGHVDVVVTGGSSGLNPFYGAGDGSFEAGSTVTTSLDNHYGLIAVDVSGDGKPDIVATSTINTTENELAVRLNATELSGPVELTISELISVLDQPLVTPALLLIVDETISVSDGSDVLPALLLSVREDVHVEDGPAVTPQLLLTVNEDVYVTDRPALVGGLLLRVDETVTVTDQPAAFGDLLLRVTEAISVNDAPRTVPALLLTVGEAIGVIDGIAVHPALLVRVDESITVDDRTEFLRAILLRVSESVVVLDDPGMLTQLLLRIRETIGVKDSLAPLLTQDPVDAIEDEVGDLVADGSLNIGQARSLLRELSRLENLIDRGRYDAALKVLAAFINHVESLRAEGTLTADEADSLLVLAAALAARIEAEMQEGAASKGGAATESPATDLPTEFALAPAWPNPFNPTTTIAFDLPEPAQVRLELYDLLGRRVSLLVDRLYEAGRHEFAVHADDLPSGTYFYRMQAGEFTGTRSVVLMK